MTDCIYKHVSIDIESLDTGTNAVILSVGAAFFDFEEHDEVTIKDTLHVGLSVEEQLKLGRTISDRTWRFWVDELTKMHKSPFPDKMMDPQQAMVVLGNWLTKIKRHETERLGKTVRIMVWCRGPQFDFVNLNSLCHQVKLPDLPVQYSSVRDARTFCAGLTHEQRDDLTASLGLCPHSAVDDAMAQVHHIAAARAQFGHPIT